MEQPTTMMNYGTYGSVIPADPVPPTDPAKKVYVYYLTGELVDETCMIVWSRLKALRAIRPQLHDAAIVKRVIIWREWCRNWNSYSAAAISVGMYYRKGRSRQNIYNIMRRMRADGILTGLPS